MKSKIAIFLLLMIFIPFFHHTTNAQDLDSYLSKGDSLFLQQFDYEKALDVYEKANEKFPDNVEVLVRISRVIVKLGETLPRRIHEIEKVSRFGEGVKKEKSLSEEEIKSAQIEQYKRALEIAEKAVKLNPNSSEAYLRRAVANAQIAMTKGIFSVAPIVNKVKEDLEKAIELGNGGNDIQAYAHYVLAKTHDEVSKKWKPARSIIGLGWADKEIALKEYKIAIKLKPDVRRFYLDYAKALLEEDEEEERIRVALLGKPNTGKSSLLNRLAGREITVVSDVPGTTRDAVDVEVEDFVFVDTAGILRRYPDEVSYWASLRSEGSLRYAEVAAVLLDLSQGITRVDRNILRMVVEEGRGLVVVLSKSDLIPAKKRTEVFQGIRDALPFVDFAPFLFVSAKTGENVEYLKKILRTVHREWKRRIPHGELVSAMDAVLDEYHPPTRVFRYVQVKRKPPTILLVVENPWPESYLRFVERRLRDRLGLVGTPIRFVQRRKAELVKKGGRR